MAQSLRAGQGPASPACGTSVAVRNPRDVLRLRLHALEAHRVRTDRGSERDEERQLRCDRRPVG
eukprot:5787538-Pyramimonas_sp.AAC.1